MPTAAQLRRGAGPAVVVIDLGRDTRWAMFRGLAAEQIAAALCYLEQVLEMAPAYSPGLVGRQLVESTVSRPLWLRPLTKMMPSLHTVDMAWVHPGGATPDALWVADVNAAYLAVASDQDFGTGDPVSVTGMAPADVREYGFFQVTATPAGSPWDGRELPSPFGPRVRVVEGWWAAPHVRAAHALGWHVEITRGLIWPRAHQHRVLRPWAQRLWQGREALGSDTARFSDSAAARTAVAFLKTSYAQTIALFAREPVEDAEPDLPAFAALGRRRLTRPDWRAWIIAECYRRRLWEIRKLVDAGRPPLAAYVDALVLPGFGDDPIDGVLRWGGLGGYKMSGVVRDRATIDRLMAQSGHVRAVAPTFMDAVQRAARHG